MTFIIIYLLIAAVFYVGMFNATENIKIDEELPNVVPLTFLSLAWPVVAFVLITHRY